MPPKSRICRAATSWPGCAGEAGVEHALDGRVPVEELGDRARVLAVALHPQRERLEAAQHEPAVERARARRRATSAGSAAARRAPGRSCATKPPITSEWPPRYFVVEWTTRSAPSSSGCCRYGVAKVLSTTTSAPAACAASAARADVDDVQQRVRRRLDPDEPSCARRGAPRGSSNSSAGDVVEAVALRLVDLRDHPVDAAVDVVDSDDALARVDEVHDRRRRAEPEENAIPCSAPSSEARQRLERVARRVRDARVVVALVLADRLLHVGRGLVDRRDDRAGRRVGLLAGVDGSGLEVHLADDGIESERRHGEPREGASSALVERARGADARLAVERLHAERPALRSDLRSARPTIRSPRRSGST